MKQLYILTKSIFLNAFRTDGKSKINGSGIISMLFGSSIFSIIFAIMTGLVSPFFIQAGLAAEFLTIVIIATQTIILFMGTIMLINVLFFGKDAELLLSLPVKSHTIFFAKLAYIYFSELMFAASILVVSGVVMGIMGGFGVFYYLMLIVGILFVPVLPIMLSAIISIPAMYLLSFLKGKPIISTLIFFIIFGGFMGLYLSFFGNIGSDPNTSTLPEEALLAMAATFAKLIPNINLAKIITLTSQNIILDTAIVLGGTIVLLILSYLLAMLSYKRGMSAQLEEKKEKSNKAVEYVQDSAFKAFIKKEIKEIIRNPGLAFNCLIPIIMAPLMILFYGKMFGGNIEELGEEAAKISLITLGFFMTMLLVGGVNFASLSSVSREGTNFDMSKTLPAPYLFQMRAKVRVADFITLGGTVASAIAMLIVMPTEIINIILFCGLVLVLGNALNYKNALADAKKPVLNWESINVALKNNKASLISMLIMFGFSIPFIVGFLLITLATSGVIQILLFSIIYAVSYAVAIFLNYLFRKSLKNNIENYIARVE